MGTDARDHDAQTVTDEDVHDLPQAGEVSDGSWNATNGVCDGTDDLHSATIFTRPTDDRLLAGTNGWAAMPPVDAWPRRGVLAGACSGVTSATRPDRVSP